MASRRVRAFKRWMKSRGIDFSDSLEFLDCPGEGISVRALCDLKDGDVIATIPKSACLAVQTTGASEMINSAGLGGSLGLSVALMYENSLGHSSPWAGYLQLLPPQESLPLVWTLEEVNSLLCGTELHKTVQEDKALICEDWKESILPLLGSAPLKLNPKFFGVEEYFAAKSLVASRSFEIDEYHGCGMVPLADLFNHKTGAENVHFTTASSRLESESDDESEDNGDDVEKLNRNSEHEQAQARVNSIRKEYSCTDSDSKSSLTSSVNDPSVLEMIMVKDVKSGSEIFNTYGALGNAALLHRYGFTEPDNPYDIVNIDLDLVLKWGSSTFSSRYCRSRLSLWRRLNYSGCISQNSEYFEVSSDGKPQIELLILLFIIFLPEETCQKLDPAISTAVYNKGMVFTSGEQNLAWTEGSEVKEDLLLTQNVCHALLQLANMRENFYGSSSMNEDIKALKRCGIREKKLYHSLALRVSERRILEKLRQYAAVGNQSKRNRRSSAASKRSKKKVM